MPNTEITTANPPGPKRIVRTIRPYSTKFTPHGETGKNYFLSRIPAGLWAAVRAKAKRDGFSLRTLILQLLTEYVEREPDDTRNGSRRGVMR
jgi:hypothetical protein